MSLRARTILVGLISLFMVYLCIPSLVSPETRKGSLLIPDQAVNLGLDLQGGIYWLLQIRSEDAIESQVKLIVDSLKSIRDDEGMNVGTPDRVVGANEIRVCGGDADELEQVVDNRFPYWSLEEDGDCERLALSSAGLRNVISLTVDQAIEVFEERLSGGGFVDPIIARQGADRILVQMPGANFDDRERALSLITQVTKLEFKKVLDTAANEELLRAKYPNGLPEDTEVVLEVAEGKKGEEAIVTEALLVPDRAVLSGSELADARVDRDSTQRAVVAFTWNSDAGQKFSEFTRENIDKRMAIIKDGKVISAPTIRARISQRGQIEGNFTFEEAQTLAVQLRAGALPVTPVIEEERSIGPSLGEDSIRAGILSISIGGALVVLFMIMYYATSGVLADLALVLNLLIVLAVMSSFQATLTLPGIAGLVLTVGMAVDANVIIFERIREELRAGRAIHNAVQIGFNRSRLTILDANVTTLIAAVVLYYIGHGPVKGFGVTLVFGIVSSVFCSLVVTRVLFDLLLARGVKTLRI